MRGRLSVVALVSLVLAFGSVPAHAHAHAKEHQTASVAGLPVVKIPAGKFTPLYRPSPKIKQIPVAAFWLMTRQVTNGEFLRFVNEHGRFRRDRVARVFADEQYLSHWQSATELGSKARAMQPVTRVSWFAARAFCASVGMRLPTEAEWELAALASSKRKDARSDPAQQQLILKWYATPTTELPDVPHGPENYYGVHDLHGVAWEWIEDWNNAVVVSDSRGQGESQTMRFCGAGVLTAQDSTDYAAFMRVAMRSSLEAAYTGALLGFRCAADADALPERAP